MRLNLKKIVLITLFIIIACGLGFGSYYLFFKPTPPKPETMAEKPAAPGILPPIIEAPPKPSAPPVETPVAKPVLPFVSEIAVGGETKVSSVVKDAIEEPVFNEATGEIFYYNRDKQEFYKVDADGRRELLLEKKFYQVEKIIWSPKKDKAILEYPDGNKIFYDFKENKQATLGKNWSDFSFSPSGNEIILKIDSENPENRWLAKANADGTGLKIIEPLGKNGDKVQAAWSPNNQIIAFSATGDPMGFDRQEILFIGLNGENFRSTIVEGRGFKGKWSPKGDKIIYNVWNADAGYRPTLWSVEAEGENIGKNRIELELNTWADKCAFSSDNQTIYCAVPRDLPEGAGLMPEAVESEDDFYKIDLVTGAKIFLAKPSEGKYNAANIFLSPGEDFIYFTDKNSGQLYKIQLK